MAKQPGYVKGEGRGFVSPIGGASRPPEIMRGGGSTGPLTIKPITEKTRRGEQPVTPRRVVETMR